MFAVLLLITLAMALTYCCEEETPTVSEKQLIGRNISLATKGSLLKNQLSLTDKSPGIPEAKSKLTPDPPTRLDSRFGKLLSQIVLNVDIDDPNKNVLDAVPIDQRLVEHSRKESEMPRLASVGIPVAVPPKVFGELPLFRQLDSKNRQTAGHIHRGLPRKAGKKTHRIIIKPNTACMAPKNSHSDSLMSLVPVKQLKLSAKQYYDGAVCK